MRDVGPRKEVTEIKVKRYGAVPKLVDLSHRHVTLYSVYKRPLVALQADSSALCLPRHCSPCSPNRVLVASSPRSLNLLDLFRPDSLISRQAFGIKNG